MSLSKKKNLSLAEKVTEALNEDTNESEDELETLSRPQVEYFDDDDYNLETDEQNKSLSQFRKQNVQLLSQQSSKYSGEVVPRKTIENTNSSSDSETSEADSTESNQWNASDYIEWKDEGNYSFSDDRDNDDESASESSERAIQTVADVQHENEKGRCVQNQLGLWEQLLEIRIHSQKIISKANSLPNPDQFHKLTSTEDLKKSTEEVQKSTETLLEKLLEAQACLANQYSEIKQLRMSTKTKHSDSDSRLKTFGPVIKSNFEKFRPYRNSVLLKWDDRTQLLSSSLAKKKREQQEFDIIKKIENSLAKKSDLIAKSQTLKGNNAPQEDKNSTTAECVASPHIYDDTDFYHSQLRELIESKTNTSSNAYDVSKQFAELQKIRQKMKKKVDTRASKGRKIRYVVHPKLMNFMAPVNTSEWTEESKDELYRSLFIT